MAAYLAHGHLCVLQIVEDFFGILVQQIARLGDQHALAYPKEERTAQLLFQLLDVLAHGGLREVEVLARAGESTGLDDCLEDSKLVKIHFYG